MGLMINKNILKGKNVFYKKLDYANFSNGLNTDIDEYILPINRSVKTYNYNFSNGALVTGLGIETLKLPISKTHDTTRDITFPSKYQIKATWVFRYTSPENTIDRDDFLIFLSTEGELFAMAIYEAGTTLVSFGEHKFSDIPTILNYKLNGYYTLLISSADGFFYWSPSIQNAVISVENAPEISTICLHNDRAFATVGGKKEEVWFSKELDPTNWNASLTEGGFISFADDRGQCNKVLTFLDRVYVFRDYGINRITGYADQTEFDVSELYVSSGQIHANTVCVCGDRIIMLTENGLYYFDGNATNKLNLYINEFLSKAKNKNAIATYFNGKYYLACYINFEDDEKIGCETMQNTKANNVLIELDINTNSINILRGIEIINFNVLSDDVISKLIACIKDGEEYKFGEITNCGKIFDLPTKKVWCSPLSDFGYPEKTKFLSSIYVTSKYPVTFTIRTEKQTKKVTKSPTNNKICFSPKISGKMLAIDFETSEAESYVSSPTVVVGLS